MNEFVVPAWVRDAVFYQIFPDRFAQCARVSKPAHLQAWDAPPTFHAFKGGDLLGVVERLDYLSDLGVNALYFLPVFQSAANHRYHTHDYMQVDPLLGGNDALRELLDAAHARSMKVVLDGVFNHASRGFFQFSHILENGAQSPYIDWFHVRSFPLYAYEPDDQPAGYDAWWGLKALPRFNTTTPAVRDYLWKVARHWVEFGIDGWRLDVPSEIDDDEFWREFRRIVKAANPDAYIVGEIWQSAERWLQGDQFDAVMNYQFTRACIEFFIGEQCERQLLENGYGTMQPCDARAFAHTLESLLHRYAPAATGVMLNLLDTHDTARFLTIARGDVSALKLATLMQMTYPGAPCVYYGTEVGLQGERDPDNRRGMLWDEAQWDSDLRDFYKRCIALRHAHPALRWGAYRSLYAQGMVYVFGRRTDDERLIVALNASTSTQSIDVPLAGFLPDGATVRDVWDTTNARVTDDKLRALKLAPRTGVVLAHVSA